MMGVNINCKKIDWIEKIFNHEKIEETRKCRSLDPYIGKRVGIIKTGCGRAMLVGFMTITGRHDYISYGEFRGAYHKHCVPKDSKFDFGKYGYRIENVEMCEPVPVYSLGIVARQI